MIPVTVKRVSKIINKYNINVYILKITIVSYTLSFYSYCY